MRQSDSGNAGYGMHFWSGAPLDLVEVKVSTRKMDGIGVPKTITLPNGRVRQVDREEYQTLMTAAQKYVVPEKKTGRLERLHKAAEKTIADLKAKLAEVMQERDEQRSVRGFLSIGALEKENRDLRQRVKQYQSILEQHGLSHLLGGRQAKEKAHDR